MKTITINVSEPIYNDFRRYAQMHDRKTSELIREAMEAYWTAKIAGGARASLLDIAPLDVGAVKSESDEDADVLDEMIGGHHGDPA